MKKIPPEFTYKALKLLFMKKKEQRYYKADILNKHKSETNIALYM